MLQKRTLDISIDPTLETSSDHKMAIGDPYLYSKKINNIRYADQQLQLNYLFKRERFFLNFDGKRRN